MLNTIHCLKPGRLLAGAISCVLWASVAQAAEIEVTSAVTRTPVVELYTSEGCSSCPRADDWMRRLGDTLNPEFHAVPLAFHVDYWNYLGWEDPFSRSEYSQRQRELGALNQQRAIYTPEFLVSGMETRGSEAVVEAIQRANTEAASIVIQLGLTAVGNDKVQAGVSLTGFTDAATSDAELYLAIYEDNITRDIKAGENGGRILRHSFVVRHWQKVARVGTGDYAAEHSVMLDSDWDRSNIGLAAVVLDQHTGATIQAVRAGLGELFAAGS